MNRARASPAFPLLALAVLLAGNGSAHHVDDLDAEAPYACSGRDCIPAIHDPRFDDGTWLRDEDRIVGVALRDESRAYPVRILNWHEIVNDEIAGEPVSVTYCPLCGTGVAFDRRLDGTPLTFGVSGRLYKNDLVLYDRETETLWSQILGEAIWGKHHGRHLELVASSTTTWGEWKKAHPDSRVLARPSTYPESRYDHYPYGDYETDERTLQAPRHPDSRIHAKTWVYGVFTSEGAIAFVRDDLQARGETVVTLGNATLHATWRDGAPHVERLHGNGTRERVIGIAAFWFAWHDFHPDTALWPVEARGGPSLPPPEARGTPGFGATSLLAGVALSLAFARARRNA